MMANKIISPPNGFTSTFLNKLKPESKPYEISDKGCKGLRIKVSIAGTKTFLTTMRVDGVRKVFTLGCYPDFGLADAHTKLGEMKSQNKNGNLKTDKQEKQDEEAKKLAEEEALRAETITLGEILEEFSELVIRKRRIPDSPLAIINAHIFGNGRHHKGLVLSGMPIRIVTKQHCKEVIFNVKEHSESMALELFFILKQFMDWAERQEYIERSPLVRGDKADWKLIKQSKKDRALDIDSQGKPVSSLPEIKKLFQILDAEHKREVSLCLKLLLLTGARTGEFRLAKKEHINLDELTWFIPKENTKTFQPEKNNDTSITIPLTQYTAQLFSELMELSDTELVTNIGRTLLSSNMKRLVNKHKFYYITPHTLRKTLRTHIIGWCSFEVAEKSLNHVLGSIASIYDHGSMLDERSEALQVWSDKVYRAVYGTGSNVVPLRG